MNYAALASVGLQIITQIAQSIQLYQDGQITEEELTKRWASVGVNFDTAKKIWESAGQPQP